MLTWPFFPSPRELALWFAFIPEAEFERLYVWGVECIDSVTHWTTHQRQRAQDSDSDLLDQRSGSK